MITACALSVIVMTLTQLPPSPQAPKTSSPSAQTPATQDRAAAPAFDQRLEELDARIAKVTDLVADFRQEKTTPLLKKPLISTGRVKVKGDRIRWDTTDPRRSSMLLTSGEIRVLYTDERTMEIYPLEGDLRQFSGTPLPRLAWLRAHFDLAELGVDRLGAKPAESGRLIGIELTPKSEQMREHVATVRVLMDTGVPSVKRLEMIDPDGHKTVFELAGVRVNTGLEDKELDLAVPDGVRISRPLDAKRRAGDKPATPAGPAAGKPDK